jgi:GT2 family glycosyltransferase
VAFTDDDCYPSPDFLTRVLEVFDGNDVACIGGRVLLYDPSDARMMFRDSEKVSIVSPGEVIDPGLIIGANMAARREVIEEVGGFDPCLGSGTPFPFEDLDFVARVSAAGRKVGYFPVPLVYHHHRRKPGKALDSEMRKYVFGRGAYFAKHILTGRYKGSFARVYFLTTRYLLRGGRFRAVLDQVRGFVSYAVSYAAKRSVRRGARLGLLSELNPCD